MTPSLSPGKPSTGDDPALFDLVEEMAARLQAGDAADVEAWIAAQGEHAERLRRLLPTVRVMAELGSCPGSAPPPGTEDGPLSGVLGDFRIVREVGRGGMGVVYEAEQISLRRRVALKVLPLAGMLDERRLRRFQNEAQAAAGLHHSHIVPVYFVGSERGVHFYAMQFIDGHTLAETIRQLRQAGEAAAPVQAPAPGHAGSDERITAQPPPAGPATTEPAARQATLTSAGARPGRDYFRRVAELAVQAAEALDHAHQLGVVHRDVKPANLMVDGLGNVWVTDFGLAQVQQGEASLTLTGDLVGTLRYMSPEQALGKRAPIDHRTDVYSLGATLYELLTLRPVFGGSDRQELLRQIAFEEPVRPRRLDRAIPAELETIVLKALEKDPAERYATAQELAEDLERWLKDQPLRARSPSLVQRVRKWARRHRAVVWAGAAVVLLAGGMLAAGLGWAAHDWATKREATAKVVNQALDEADQWQRRGRLPEALSAAQRADGLVAGGTADDALRRRVRLRVNDLDLLASLEEARVQMSAVRNGQFDLALGERRYGEIFRTSHLDVEAGSVEEAARRLRESTVAVELAAALDHWAITRRHLRGRDDASWKRLLDVARAADPDAQRDRLRRALRGRDRRALVALAAAKSASQLPLPTALALEKALRDLGAYEEALALLKRVQRHHPNDFWINTSVFITLRSMKAARHEEALRFCTAAVALRPQSPGARVNLGDALRDSGDLDGAVAELREALRLQNDYAEAHNDLGVALADQEHRDRAIAEYREAIRLRNDYADAHNNLGAALLAKGDVDAAIAECRVAVKLRNDIALFHKVLGEALLRKRIFEEAIREFQAALRIDPQFADAHNGIGCVLSDRGDWDGAMREFRAALRLNPRSAAAHRNLGNGLHGKGDVEGALREYRAAIEINPRDWQAHANLGAVLSGKGDREGAIRELQAALQINSGYGPAHSNLANILFNKGDVDGAVRECKAALRINPRDAAATFNLGLALKKQGQLAEAVTCYQKALGFGARLPAWYRGQIHGALGQALVEQGRFTEARDSSRRCLELLPMRHPLRSAAARQLRRCERFIALDARLPALLQDQGQPDSAVEGLEYAQLCLHRQQYAAAARFMAAAFAADPKLAPGRRYNAACAAALAGGGRGKDVARLDDKERARLRQQALDWLRADLTASRGLLEKEPERAGPPLRQQLRHWQQDPDFAGVRGPEALARLPAGERLAWQKLWADVAEVLARATGKDSPEKKSLTK